MITTWYTLLDSTYIYSIVHSRTYSKCNTDRALLDRTSILVDWKTRSDLSHNGEHGHLRVGQLRGYHQCDQPKDTRN